VISGLDAEETKLGWYKGRLVQAVNVVAHDIQLRAAEILLKLHNAYPGRYRDDETSNTAVGPSFTVVFADPERAKWLWTALPISRAVLHPLHWARRWTKTKDEEDTQNPYKNLPNHEYFDALHAVGERFKVLFVAKSRTMMASWWAVIEDMHYVMTHSPAKSRRSVHREELG
jgi:hypothetical protein